jgi:hypothetical protein
VAKPRSFPLRERYRTSLCGKVINNGADNGTRQSLTLLALGDLVRFAHSALLATNVPLARLLNARSPLGFESPIRHGPMNFPLREDYQ